MFKKNIIKISLVMNLIALAFPATTNAMQKKDEPYITKDKKENKTNDFKPNSLNKIETLKENTPKSENREKQKLNDLDLSLTNLIKDFNAELVKIKETSNNYAGSRLIKTIEKHIQELKEKEYFPPWEITNENDDNLHSKKTFDIYKVTSDLLNNVEKMENLLIDLETKYQEYLKFTKNIKHKKLLDSYNNKNNIKIFNTDIGYLQNVISFILFTVNLPNWDFCKKLNDEKIYKTTDKTKIFKKQIEIRKEIILFIKKVVQSDIIKNMEAKILDAVDEEAKIRNQYH